MKKQTREKLATRQQVEKSFMKAVDSFRKIRGFVNLDVKATIKIQDADPNKAIVLLSKHSV